ncbi:endochitinase 2 [Colossoma macropomum]|uniref:endochitinase 2 n=1 Tax=Colossoma macropomum TaxID=42526 RepID=UPI0018642E73|nr:endochitinase 2 [Colossoma macropomum]
MCGLGLFLSTVFFSLVLGPHVTLLHAQELEPSTLLNTTSQEPKTESSVTSSENIDLVPSAKPEDGSNSTMGNLAAEALLSVTEPVSAGTFTVAPQQVVTTPLPETNPVTTPSQEAPTTTVHDTTTTTQVITDPAGPELTSLVEFDKTTVMNEVTTTMTEATTHTPTPAVPTSALTTVKASEATSKLIPLTEAPVHTTPGAVETTVSSMETTTSSMATTPSAMATTHLNTILTTQHQAEDSIPDTTHPFADLSTTNTEGFNETVAVNEISGNESVSGGTVSKRLTFIIIAVVVIACLIIFTFCVIILVKRRKRRGTQHFGQGYMNGRSQRSKKKKGEDDAWAGPVNLEGGEKGQCEGPEEGGQGDDKNPDGTDAVLSTFAAVDENGGIGRPGSMEVQKWEEKEPLLYIDEEAKGEGREKQKEAGQKEEEDTKGKTEMEEPKVNGGEAFCLTTAV